MKFIVINSLMFLFGMTFQNVSAAPSKSHNHNGRVHSHILPAAGVKHYHKHTHGGRSHIHPLPVSGNSHFHTKKISKHQAKKQTPRKYRNSIQRQIDAVLNSHAGDRPIAAKKSNQVTETKKKPTVSKLSQATMTVPNNAILNKATINKVINYGKHQHNGRSHQHALPASGKMHSHKYLQKVLQTKNSTMVKSNTSTKPAKTLVNKQMVVVPRKQVRKPFKPRNPKQIENATRQFKIGLRYENGSGVEKNIKQAMNWYLRAAKQGNASAQVNLGNLYATGNGIPKNTQEAIKWYTLAANQGDMRGRANLNYMVER